METKNYSKFKFYFDNRNVTSVDRIKESIQKIGYIKGRPVIVDEKFNIIDGQNRFVACKELEMPIIYDIQKTNGIGYKEIMLELNKNQSTWRLNEYINHFAANKVKYHSVVKEFEEKYKMGISNSIIICSGIGRNTAKPIRDGIDIPLDNKREEVINYLMSFSDIEFWKTSKFVIAIKIFIENNKVLPKDKDKLNKSRMQISQQAVHTAYVKNFEHIINKNRSEKITL